MQGSWEKTLEFVWRPENDGQGPHSDPEDPGGLTSWGVTLGTWQAAQMAGVTPKGVGLAQASQAQLAGVLKWECWEPVWGDELPLGVDLVVANMAMVSGGRQATSILQQSLGMTRGNGLDGVMGQKTLAAALAADPWALIGRLTNNDDGFFSQLTGFKYFGNGWERRALDAAQTGVELLIGAGK